MNPDSKRSQAVQHRKADHTLLITATPINKKADDLLRLIELLDVDNLTDEDFSLFKKLKEQPRKKLENQDLENLRGFISQFLVRRTKSELNNEIKKNPDQYLNKHGIPCRFPVQNCPTYLTEETDEDIQIALEITNLAKQLKGLIYLKNIRKPDYELKNEEEENVYIANRLRAATALCTYMIRSSLRSSNAALVEHIEGSDKAAEAFSFKTSKNKTGNQLAKLETFKKTLPKIGFKKSQLPDWITSGDSYIKACTQEIEIYKKISRLAKKLSGKRELGKVKKLITLQKKHKLIVAFDSTTITLDFLKALFEKEKARSKVYVVKGDNRSTSIREKVIEEFKLGSKANNCIALCSDQMAEGVNLQQASAVMLLDMPSVLRIVEQRIGRIDRMDSPHDEIEAFWPEESEAFGLKGDERLVDTTILAEHIYGSNVTLPRVFREKHFSKVDTVEDSIKEYKEFVEKDVEWQGIHNSFQPVVDLKEGKNSIIPESTYEAIKSSKVSIKARVSFVSGTNDWCFFALRGTKTKSPRWFLIDENDIVHTEFPDICNELSIKLSGKPKELKWRQDALERFIYKMRGKERDLLPPKKKRALMVAEQILTKKFKNETDPVIQGLIKKNLDLFVLRHKGVIVDFDQFASQWIDILQPHLDQKRAESKRKRTVYNLSSLIRDHKKIELSKDLLENTLENCPFTDEVDQKIASCIIGVKTLVDSPKSPTH